MPPLAAFVLGCAVLAVGEEGFTPAQWCGSTGWMSGFPLLIAAFVKLGFSNALLVGLSIAFTCCFLSLLVLWNVFLQQRGMLALFFASVFPGAIWYHAVFPLSVLTLFSLLALWALRREQWLVAGLCGFVAGTMYTSAFVLAGVLGLYVLLAHRRLGPALLVGALTAAGYAAVLAWQGAHTGAWNGIFLVQSRFQFGLSNPLVTLLARLKPIVNRRYWDAFRLAWAFQEVVTLSLMIGVFAVLRAWREDRDVLLLGLYGAVFWIFPLCLGGMVSLHRSDAAMLPIAALVPRLPRGMQWALFVAAVPVAAFTGALYMLWRLA